jgi:hypothetical protein
MASRHDRLGRDNTEARGPTANKLPHPRPARSASGHSMDCSSPSLELLLPLSSWPPRTESSQPPSSAGEGFKQQPWPSGGQSPRIHPANSPKPRQAEGLFAKLKTYLSRSGVPMSKAASQPPRTPSTLGYIYTRATVQRLPLLMFGLFVLGLAFSIAHCIIYNQLNGKIVGDSASQQQNLRYW